MNVILVDINPDMVAAWRAAFAEEPSVRVVRCSMLEIDADAWVTPTNAAGKMDGGLDGVLKKHFGAGIEKAVQAEIARGHHGHLEVGAATCVPTGRESPRFLISAATMTGSAEDISGTGNVALACAAAFQAIHQQNRREPGSIGSVALPGLGASTGRVPPSACANLMWSAWSLYRDFAFSDYASMRAALAGQLDGAKPVRYKVP